MSGEGSWKFSGSVCATRSSCTSHPMSSLERKIHPLETERGTKLRHCLVDTRPPAVSDDDQEKTKSGKLTSKRGSAKSLKRMWCEGAFWQSAA